MALASAQNTASDVDTYFGRVDYAVYQAYLDGGKQDKRLFKQFSDNAFEVLLKSGTTLIQAAPILQAKDRLIAASKGFFGLDEDVKAQFIFKDYDERAFVPYGMKKKEDYKELYHVDNAIYQAILGQPITAIKNVRNADELTKQLRINDLVHDWNGAVVDYTQKGLAMGEAFLDVFADKFKLDAAYVQTLKQGNNSVLRLLRYMPFDKEKLKGVDNATRALAHKDINLITFLATSPIGGLQIVPKDTVHNLYGSAFVSNAQFRDIPDRYWVSVPHLEDACAMNIGSITELLSNGILTATGHRVIVPPSEAGKERFTSPFFYHAPLETELNVLDEAIALRGGINYFAQKGEWPMTVGDYIHNQAMRPLVEPTGTVPVYRPA